MEAMKDQGDLGLFFGQAGADWWADGRAEELIIAAAVLAALMAVAAYVVARVRGQATRQEFTSSDLLSRFREARQRGSLSDEEFESIKSRLSEELGQEVNNTEETG